MDLESRSIFGDMLLSDIGKTTLSTLIGLEHYR